MGYEPSPMQIEVVLSPHELAGASDVAHGAASSDATNA